MNKVYKGRQKLSLEQAAGYYKHAYKIGVEHGRYSEQNRIVEILLNSRHINSDQGFLLKKMIEADKE